MFHAFTLFLLRKVYAYKTSDEIERTWCDFSALSSLYDTKNNCKKLF